MRLRRPCVIQSVLLGGLVCLLVCGCQNKTKLTKEDMDRIKNGMSEQEVFDILGKGKTVAPGADFSSLPGIMRGRAENLANSGGKCYEWKSGRTLLLVRFTDGKVSGMFSGTYNAR